MKIEMTTDYYSSAQGFKLVGAGVHEVPNSRGKYLLSTFPTWFRPVEGEPEVAPVQAVSDPQAPQEPDAPEAPQDAPEEPQPTKPLSRMNKDELTALADELGMAIDGEVPNDELREVIKLHQQELAESGEDEAEGDAV